MEKLMLLLLPLLASCTGQSQRKTEPDAADPEATEISKDNGTGTDGATETLAYFYEAIPGIDIAAQGATAWGYNQSKIVRRGDTIFTYIEEIPANHASPYKLWLYKKTGSAQWERGAGLDCGRPGNILIDSQGTLHAIVFEPTDITVSDSIGKVKHYTFAGAGDGNITKSSVETVIDNDGTYESANIRIGAAISSNDRLTFAFGLGVYEPALNQTERVYFKDLSDTAWTQRVAGSHLEHDHYYPFVLSDKDDFHLFAIQDDYREGLPNLYQFAAYFKFANGSWRSERVVDHTKHRYSVERPRLVEQDELYLDATGNVHLIYNEDLLPNSPTSVSSFKHLTSNASGGWTTETIDLTAQDMNWLRIIEIDGVFFYAAASYGRAYIIKAGTNEVAELIALRDKISGAYVYVANPKGGTARSEKFVDVLFLSSNGTEDGKASSYYVRIPKSEFANFK